VENINFSLSSLVIVTTLALLVPLVVSRIKMFRVPIVVGEIIVGVIVGKSGLNLIAQSQWLQFLEFFGLAYLMFVSGLEIDFQALRPGKPDNISGLKHYLVSPPIFAALTTVVTFVLSYLFSTWLHQVHIIGSPLMFALILSTTSLTVVVPVLKEYDLLSNPYGQLLLAAAMFADFATMLMISVAASIFQGGTPLNILLVLVLMGLLGVLYLAFKYLPALRHTFRSLAHGTAQLGIRGSLALLIIFIVLSEKLGVQVILGTFLAGMFVGTVSGKERTEIHSKLDAIGFGFVIPIFFIMIGVNFNIHALWGDKKALLLLPLLFIATYAFKILPALILRLRFQWRKTFAGAILNATQMSVTIAAAEVGLQIGAINQGIATAIILVAMLTALISPIAFGKILPHETEHIAEETVIVGDSPEAYLLVEQIKNRGEPYNWVFLKESLMMTEPETYQAHTGKALTLNALGISAETTHALVAYTQDDGWNIALAELARAANIPIVICNIRDLKIYQQHRTTTHFIAVNPQLSIVHFVDQLVHYPVATQWMTSAANLQIHEVHVHNHQLHGRRLMDLRLPGNLLVLSIVRDDVQMVPHGQTTLNVGDLLVVVGELPDIHEFSHTAQTPGADL
jgi:Kef-type K+ transport system membrane component KefB/Trk K+ transport system NAD-binding subunit